MVAGVHSTSFFGLPPQYTMLYLQRTRIFLVVVLFALIATLSFIGPAGNTGRKSIPASNIPNNFKSVQQQPKPNNRPPPLSSKKVSNSDESSSVPQDRTYYNVSSPYNNIITSCSLVKLGERYNDDKFTNHNYQNLYCEVLRDFQRSQRKMRMLEIGFGCGHNVHQPNQQGVSALIWKEYFDDGGGSGSGNGSGSSSNSLSSRGSNSLSGSGSSSSSGIDLYEVDLKSPAHLACVNKYLANHTSDIVQAIYLGDQSNKPFLNEVRVMSLLTQTYSLLNPFPILK